VAEETFRLKQSFNSFEMTIHFGTSGWRAVVADEFTFAAIGRVTDTICSEFRENSPSQPVIVAHDTRFLGEEFAQECAQSVARQGFDALLCSGPTPTPAVSYAIRSQNCIWGINFTASHNPPEYYGMKLSTADGAPALPVQTRKKETRLASADRPPNMSGEAADVRSFDSRSPYLTDLLSKIRFDVIAKAGGSYAYDPMWGTGRGYLDHLLREQGLTVETIHDWRDVLFGGRSPEPEASHLEELKEVVLRKKCVLGLATDGDGDRFGIIDANGKFVTPNQLIAILFDYLAESRGWQGGVARSVATSHLVDRAAQMRGRDVHETPVGFKFIGELINEDKIILGGEESAGLSIKGHYPEKDGILACLLAAEAVASRGASLTDQLENLFGQIGRLESGRIGVRVTPELMPTLKEKLKQEPTVLAGRKIKHINRIDGLKFIFQDDSWLLVRPSGTEPLVRIYAESESAEDMEVLLEQGRKYLLG
jgi:phosphoglucomutase